MSLLSYTELCELIERGVIEAPMCNVNPASIEVTLGDYIMVEKKPAWYQQFVNLIFGDNAIRLYQKESINLERKYIGNGYVLKPGEFILASTVETFNLPNDIVAEYICKSSMCRNGLNHLLAGYADPGFHNSKLTLELKNESRYHDLMIMPTQKIGQLKMYRVNDVPEDKSYAVTGQYNNQDCVQESKGIR